MKKAGDKLLAELSPAIRFLVCYLPAAYLLPTEQNSQLRKDTLHSKKWDKIAIFVVLNHTKNRL